jgi:hypothetical protein
MPKFRLAASDAWRDGRVAQRSVLGSYAAAVIVDPAEPDAEVDAG